MQKLLVSIIIILPFVVWSQQLPSEMSFSSDNKRLVSGATEVTGLYNPKKLRRIDLIFDQPDYWTQLTANYTSKTDILATLIYEGVSYPNVGVRFKGQTSYSRVPSQKKSFNITLDFMDPNQDLKGYETLNFNNSFEDNSFIREVLYENITRPFCPSLKANYIHLYINGQDWGLYPNVQALDGAYVKEWFLSNDGTRWRCERVSGPGGPPGGGGFGAGTSSLNYLGDDTTSYKPHYTLKNTSLSNPWDDLVRVTKILNTIPLNELEDTLNKVFDIDRALWFLAKEILFGDDDSYVNKGGMDYYVIYQKDVERLIPLEYDANTVMKSQTSNWSIFLKETDTKFPLTNRLFAVPSIRQRYLAHFRTLFNNTLDSTWFKNQVEYYYSHIDSVVQTDPKKLMTYSAFLTEKNVLFNWMRSRRNFVLSNTEFKQVGNIISEVTLASGGTINKSPDEKQTADITAKISGGAIVKEVYLHYAPGYDGYFQKVQMWDDGNHNDDKANDGIYGASIPSFANGIFVRYYIETIAANPAGTRSYMPEGAEHDVYIYQVELHKSANQNIVINEFMASNQSSVSDQDGEFDDWIELYNTSSEAVDISAWILTDNPANLDKYRIPSGTIMPPDSYLIIWADENGKQKGYHANFKLSASGEELSLLDSSGLLVDKVVFGPQITDMSYSRKPNGTGDFKITSHTFNKNNDGLTNNEEYKTSSVKIYPNPAKQWFIIDGLEYHKLHNYQIVTYLGQFVKSGLVSNTEKIDISNLHSGIYIISINNERLKLIIN
jgi:hypothetical protein